MFKCLHGVSPVRGGGHRGGHAGGGCTPGASPASPAESDLPPGCPARRPGCPPAPPTRRCPRHCRRPAAARWSCPWGSGPPWSRGCTWGGGRGGVKPKWVQGVCWASLGEPCTRSGPQPRMVVPPTHWCQEAGQHGREAAPGCAGLGGWAFSPGDIPTVLCALAAGHPVDVIAAVPRGVWKGTAACVWAHGLFLPPHPCLVASLPLSAVTRPSALPRELPLTPETRASPSRPAWHNLTGWDQKNQGDAQSHHPRTVCSPGSEMVLESSESSRRSGGLSLEGDSTRVKWGCALRGD